MCGNDLTRAGANGPRVACVTKNTANGKAGCAIKPVLVREPFIDNGDGTITDGRAGLTWEKHSDEAAEQGNQYAWAVGFSGFGITTWSPKNFGHPLRAVRGGSSDGGLTATHDATVVSASENGQSAPRDAC